MIYFYVFICEKSYNLLSHKFYIIYEYIFWEIIFKWFFFYGRAVYWRVKKWLKNLSFEELTFSELEKKNYLLEWDKLLWISVLLYSSLLLITAFWEFTTYVFPSWAYWLVVIIKSILTNFPLRIERNSFLLHYRYYCMAHILCAYLPFVDFCAIFNTLVGRWTVNYVSRI